MDLKQATDQLDRLRNEASLARLASLVDEIRPALAQDHPADATLFMLAVCDMLASVDLGNYTEQPRLLFRYANETLMNPGLSLPQRLELLSHLEEDFPIQQPDWPELRERRSQDWLQALQEAMEAMGPAPAETPLLALPVPGSPDLPSGVPPEIIGDDAVRAQYEQALTRNQDLSARVASDHRMRLLLAEYQPRAVNYITRAFNQPPRDLLRMQQLLSQAPSANWRTAENPGSAT
jgi:hypothetical protein